MDGFSSSRILILVGFTSWYPSLFCDMPPSLILVIFFLIVGDEAIQGDDIIRTRRYYTISTEGGKI